jgi:glycosyltransferase involved in cell wall biosynthesis
LAVTEEKLCILSIAHTATSRAAGRLRYAPLEKHSDLDVHLVVPQRWKQFGRIITADPPPDPGVTTHVLPILFPSAGPFSWYLHVYPGLRQLIGRLRPHVIHLWEEPWSLVALQARLFKKHAGLVLEVDQNILKTLPPPFEQIRKSVLSRTDHILSRSRDATMVVQARGYSGPVTMIGYGVDDQVFTPAIGKIEKDLTQLVLGYVGRLIEEKGVQDVLEAMARVPFPVKLKLMGEGPYEAHLREKARFLGLSDQVTFEPWNEPKHVAAFLRSLDALVLMTHTTPTVKEQFGRVIIEAQGCGIPVIGARSGSIPDVIGVGGWIVPERDPIALASLVSTIHNDRRSLAAKSSAALLNVRTRYTQDAIASQLATAWKAAARSGDW